MQDLEKEQSFMTKYNLVFLLFVIAIFISLLLYYIPFHTLGKPQNKVKKVYYADNITQAHEKLIDSFNNKYRGQIEIVPINLPFTKFNTNERKEVIARALRNPNSRIDIFAVDQIWVPRFAKWAEPLSQYFSRKEIMKILPQALSTCYYGEKLVGLPLHVDVGVLYYRKDIIKKYSQYPQLENKLKSSITWEELIQLSKEYGTLGPFYMFQGDSYEGLVCNFLEILGGHGGRLFINNELQLNHTFAKESSQLMVDLINKYSMTPKVVTTFNENSSYQYAIEYDIPFFRGWPTFFKEITTQAFDTAKVNNINIAALPHFKGHKPTSIFGGWNLMISKHSVKKQEAVLFLKYLMTMDAQRILYETAGFLPSLNEIYSDNSLLKTYPNLLFFKQLIDEAHHRPAYPNYTKLSDILSFYINSALKGEISSDEALSQATDKIQSSNVLID